MNCFGDDVLSSIFNWVLDTSDRKSLSLVCKQWLKIEGLTRLHIRVFEPELLPNFLPRFPNLVSFESSHIITDDHVKFLAKTCPKLENLNLCYKDPRKGSDEFDEMIPFLDLDADVGDCGISAVAVSCCNLTSVSLRMRYQVGDHAVILLAKCLINLIELDLGECDKITDASLEAIGKMNLLQVLNLEGCWLITDVGLDYLTSGNLFKTLRKLAVAECDRITDSGVWSVKKMCYLEELNLADCGPRVTDIGGMAIAEIQTLKRLKLSWLINVSDHTLVQLARFSQKLKKLDLTGCISVTGYGIRAFANHCTLESLVLASCANFTGDDVEQMILGCRTLTFIALDKRMRMWIPITVQNDIIRKGCWIDWR